MKFTVFSSQFSVKTYHFTPSPPRPLAPSIRLLVSLSPCLLVFACNQPPAVNPFRDDSIPQSTWTTPSQEGILAANQPAVLRVRDVPPTDAPIAREEVPHYPLWWEDPFEDKGDGDCQFAWTWADYLAMAYSPARYVLNSLAWPVSAVVTPPGTPMVSDGQLSPGGLGCDHDAARGISPDPQASAADFKGDIEAEPVETAPAE